MEKIFAKSDNKTLLTDHCRNVKNVSNKIVNLLPNVIKDNEKWLNVINLSSLLHDIGKSTTEFQKNLKKGIEGYSKNKFRHNEVGWAFCYRYLNVPTDILTPILYNVYWHHGISNQLSKYGVSEILDSIDEEDVNIMKQVLIELLIGEGKKKKIIIKDNVWAIGSSVKIKIKGNKKLITKLYNYGLGQSTGSGFGTIYKVENFEKYKF